MVATRGIKMEDHEIIDLCYDRAQQAITETSSKYNAYCMHIARAILGDEEDAKECVNDTWLKAWNTIPPQKPKHLAAYLGRITRNASIDRMRTRTRKQRGGRETELVLEELQDCIAHSTNVEREIEGRELTAAINAFLGTLSAFDRNVFVCRYWYLDPVRDIAKATHASESRIKSILFRLRKKLRVSVFRRGGIIMMDEKKLLDAMSDIDENYIQDAKNFRERKVVRGRFAAKSVAAAAIVVLLAGTTVYGATVLVKQLHMKGYTSVENLAKDHGIKPWQSDIGYQDADFNEDGFKDLTPKAFIDILTDADSNQAYTIERGKATDKWNRKLIGTGVDDEFQYFEAYDYDHLSDALADWNIPLDVSYIEEKYSRVAGEYGCDFYYADDSKKDCLQSRFFSGFRDADENFVSVELASDQRSTNEDPYELYSGNINISYYTTKDGVEVYMTNTKGKSGKTYTTANVYTEHDRLTIGMYGNFATDEAEKILDSLNVAEGLHIDTTK